MLPKSTLHNRSFKLKENQKVQRSLRTRFFLGLIGLILLLAIIRMCTVVAAHQPSAIPEIKSGYAGLCLDQYHNDSSNGSAVVGWPCNGTAAQNWLFSSNHIVHEGQDCVTLLPGSGTEHFHIVSLQCNRSNIWQEWIQAIGGYENPTTATCLSLPEAHAGTQLVALSCNQLTQPSEAWEPGIWSRLAVSSSASTVCAGTERQKIVCIAAQQWVTWQAAKTNHTRLLNQYADGNGYEEWCADFISYVYKQAGYAFTQGERDGWDEYLADNIQFMGLTYHSADAYTPQSGDVAFFNYPGGHVELVAVGGKKPIFIYGDSGATDPATGNGEMAENTILSDGSLGHVVYYLSPT